MLEVWGRLFVLPKELTVAVYWAVMISKQHISFRKGCRSKWLYRDNGKENGNCYSIIGYRASLVKLCKATPLFEVSARLVAHVHLRQRVPA